MKHFFLIPLFWAIACKGFTMVTAAGSTIVIDQPVYEDLYLAGGTITINAPVHGDIVVAGGTIYINDSVTRDILLVGGDVTINGYTGGKIRCAGGRLQITGNVLGDLVIGGGTITIERSCTVFGNLLATGGNLILDGNVNGNVMTTARKFSLYGIIGGDLDCRGISIEIDGSIHGKSILAASTNLDISDNALFNGDVHYWTTDKTINFGQSLKNAKAIQDERLVEAGTHWYFLGSLTLLGLFWHLGMALVSILLLQYLFASTFRKAGDTALSKTFKSMGSGFLFLAGMPILIVFAFITLIGAHIGLVLLYTYITALLWCSVIISVVASNWLNNRSQTKWKFWRLVWGAFGFYILLRFILLTPFLGWLIFFLLICISFGAILLNVNWKKPIAPPGS